MSTELLQQALQRGWRIKRVVCEATVLHAGWEMDNAAIVAELEDGQIVGLSTSHGGVCLWSRAEAMEALARATESAESIAKALTMLPAD